MKNIYFFLTIIGVFSLLLQGCGGGAKIITPGVLLPTSCGDSKVLNRLGVCVTFTIEGNQAWYLNSSGQKVYFGQGSDLDKEYILDAQGNKTYLN